MANEKHIGFYDNREQFNLDINRLDIPWVAYVKSDKGYEVLYSDDVTIKETAEYKISDLVKKIKNVEDSHVCCTEEEMDAILNNSEKTVTITDIMEYHDDKDIKDYIFVKRTIDYSPNTFFYVYNSKNIDPTKYIEL